MLPLIKMILRRYPAVVKAMAVRHIMYNRQLEEINEREQKGTSIIIRPPEALGISRLENDPEKLESVYQSGRIEAERMLPSIKHFLSKI